MPWEENGVFRFDFLTLVRPPPDAIVPEFNAFRLLMKECGVEFGKPGHADRSKYHGQYLYALLRLATSDCYCTCEQVRPRALFVRVVSRNGLPHDSLF